jgi:outer membrane protein assembly factor BamB
MRLRWSTDNGPDVPTRVTDGTYFYSVRDNGVMWCLDAKTGASMYRPAQLRPGTYSSSPVLADGKLYISNEDGLTSVVQAGPKFEILAENALEDYILSSPAICDGQVFLRTTGHLWAVGKRRPATTSSK